MSIILGDFKDLLEKYFVNKNVTENGSKQSTLDDIKMEIYDNHLNEDFERNSSVGPSESKVWKEFFMEADNFEKKYMESSQSTIAEMAKESNGYAMLCAIEFTQDFKRFDLLKPELRSMLEPSPQMRGSSKKRKSKKRKSKKRKSKKRKSKKRKSKKRKSKKLK